ncbi:tyrosine-type recombinase/integrase [Hymenobacter sp. BT523]|uniref:site-specific integrase n=1 Tax=Hymenobacter sp. BT523 TaxID=2795725 RepID=UPI0018EE08A8|nr:site-specific integrase [Hymenobacter sp. BT523]MBJ6107728.1 tyrosine-type recombinase/integrase [Hymenobacter sp. BT523]
MTTKFVLRVQKMDAAGRCPVYLMAYFDGLRLVHSTGEKCKPADWNADRQKFRASYPLAEEANMLLTRLTAEALAWWRKLRAAGETATLEGLKAALRPAPAPEAVVIKQESVTVWYDEYRRSMKARGYAFETLRHNLVTRNWMACFEKWAGVLLDPTTYNMALHDRLMVYLREERKLAPNSVATAIKDLKTFLRWLRDERGVAVGIEISKLVIKSFDTPKLYLTAAELDRIASAMLPANLVPTRDIFLFCCYTGLRYSDVSGLHRGHLHEWDGGRLLKLMMSKTRAGVSIYLTSAASAILDKYDDPERLKLLPVHPNQVMNKYLKRVAKLAGLTGAADLVSTESGGIVRAAVPKCELVTMHTARHTFATQSLLRGMPVEVLQKVLGHKKVQTTLIYAKIIEDFQHQTMRRIWDGQLGEMDSAGARSNQICDVAPAVA